MKAFFDTIKQRKDYLPELIIFFCGMPLGVILIIYTYTQPWASRSTPDGIGLAPFPAVFLALISIMSLLCFIESCKNFKANKEVPKGDVINADWGPMVGIFAVSVASSYAVSRVDPVMLAVIMSTLILILGKIRKWQLYIMTALILSFVVFVIMIRIAGVFFPSSLIW